jgi:hypothetical protein
MAGHSTFARWPPAPAPRLLGYSPITPWYRKPDKMAAALSEPTDPPEAVASDVSSAMPLRVLLNEFGPDEIAVLTQAFEQCLVELNLTNREDPATQLVAKAIFDAAKRGERDPKRLSEIATKALSK